MQTTEIKKDYAVAVLDPAGNVTALVLSDVPAAERVQVAARLLRLPELHIEQAAFLTAPRCGGEIRLEMMGGEFCGNALRCAGFYHALRTGAQGKTCVFAEISGAEGVQPVRERPEGREHRLEGPCLNVHYFHNHCNFRFDICFILSSDPDSVPQFSESQRNILNFKTG